MTTVYTVGASDSTPLSAAVRLSRQPAEADRLCDTFSDAVKTVAGAGK